MSFELTFIRSGLGKKTGRVDSQIEKICNDIIVDKEDWTFDILNEDDEPETVNDLLTYDRTVEFTPSDEGQGWRNVVKLAQRACEASAFHQNSASLTVTNTGDDFEEEEEDEELGEFSLTLRRGKLRRKNKKITAHVGELVRLALELNPILSGWESTITNGFDSEVVSEDGSLYYDRTVTFAPPENREGQWPMVVGVIQQAAGDARYHKNGNNMEVLGVEEVEPIAVPSSPSVSQKARRSSIAVFSSPTVTSFTLNEEGLEGEKALHKAFQVGQRASNNSNDPAGFNRLFDVDSQKRQILRAIRAGQNVALYGPPGCGKTSMAKCIGANTGDKHVDWVMYDATSLTQAGALTQLLGIGPDGDAEGGAPSFDLVIIEEIEKSEEKETRWLLGALDPERREIQITNAKVGRIVAPFESVVITTINDIAKFKRWHKGALESRFQTSIHFPRPTRETLKKILFRELEGISGAKPEWAELTLRFCYDVPGNLSYYQNDPRKISSVMLMGQEDLESQEYYDDILNCRG
jgi:hypothetical protein